MEPNPAERFSVKEKLTEQFQMEALQLKNTPSIEIELMIFQFDIVVLKKIFKSCN